MFRIPKISTAPLLGLLCFVSFPVSAQTPVRIVASNVTSGNFQAYEAPGIAILQGLRPDVALMQEFNVGGANDTAAVNAFVANTFGPGFSWFRETGAQIPNGIVSRWPIVAAGQWDDAQVSNRDFVWARIDIPGSRDLYAISVHFLTSNATTRNAEASAIINTYLPTLAIPTDAYLTLGGDLNSDSRTEACIGTLASRFVTASPYPVGQNGNANTNAGRTKPYDWVLADPNLHAVRTATVYGAFSYTNGLVFDTRDYTQTQLNDAFPPAQIGNSAAPSMQHMAVVRTFLIPDTPPASVGEWQLYELPY